MSGSSVDKSELALLKLQEKLRLLKEEQKKFEEKELADLKSNLILFDKKKVHQLVLDEWAGYFNRYYYFTTDDVKAKEAKKTDLDKKFADHLAIELYRELLLVDETEQIAQVKKTAMTKIMELPKTKELQASIALEKNKLEADYQSQLLDLQRRINELDRQLVELGKLSERWQWAEELKSLYEKTNGPCSWEKIMRNWHNYRIRAQGGLTEQKRQVILEAITFASQK